MSISRYYLSTVILLMQKDSLFFKEYSKGLSKNDYWDYTYEDVMNIIAVLPEVCALIYTNKYKVKPLDVYNESSDLIGRFCQLMGFDDENFHDFMRLYMIIHCDHEGGNASAHT
jgi:citrate synthase